MKRRLGFLGGLLAALLSTQILAGPIVVGGEDLSGHGSYSGGTTVGGWHYIQVILDRMLQPGNVTRPGHDGSIAALGCSPGTETTENGGAAIHFAAEVALGKTVRYYDGASEIDGFFAALAAGTVNPGVIWISGTGANSNDQDPSEVAAINCRHGESLRQFINSGGGVFSHGYGNYDWLTGILPGLVEVVVPSLEACYADGAQLTPQGAAAYPGLSVSDFDITAGGPCHAHFEGNLGPFQPIAVDRIGRPYILGANATIPAQTGFRISPAGTCCGYRFGTLATGFENTSGIGPLGVLPVADGYVVSLRSGKLLKFAGHVDGQSRASATQLADFGDGGAVGLAQLGQGVYLAQQTQDALLQINPATGGVVRNVASIDHATGIVSFPPIGGHPKDGRLFVSQAGGTPNAILEVNPSAPPASAVSVFNSNPADGLCITPDGSRMLTANGNRVDVFNTTTGAQVDASPALCDSADGIALGQGRLTGKAYVNCTNGEVWEWKFDAAATDSCPSDAPPGPARLIAAGGSRGDFIAVDPFVPSRPNGGYPSLLLTQSDRILRLGYSEAPTGLFLLAEPQALGIGPADIDPILPDGGWFGPPTSVAGLHATTSVPAFSEAALLVLSLAILTAGWFFVGRNWHP